MKFVMLFLLAADQAPKPPQAPPEAKAEKPPHVSPKVEAKTLRHTPTPIIRRVRSGNC